MERTIIWRKMPAVCLSLGMLFIIGGCVSDRLEECRTGADREVAVTFRISTPNVPGTKAGEITGAQEGTIDENWIDLSTVKFLLFDGAGAFLQDISAVAQAGEADDMWDLYAVKASFKESYFSNPLFAGGNVPFKLMVLANWPATALAHVALNCGTVRDVEAAGAYFELPSDYESFPKFGSAGIPMYGLLDCSVPQAVLAESAEDKYVELGDVYMLRCLAKIEFIDLVKPSDGFGYPRITSVRMKDYNSVARIVPYDFRNGMQVSSPTYPEGNVHVSDGGINFKGSLSAYIPETPSSVLSFEVTISYSGTDAGNKYTITPVDVWGPHLLRNHIYRVRVTSASEIHLSYTVCPWDKAEIGLPPYLE